MANIKSIKKKIKLINLRLTQVENKLASATSQEKRRLKNYQKQLLKDLTTKKQELDYQLRRKYRA